MVCEKCELKLKHVATPDPFKMQGLKHFQIREEILLNFLNFSLIYKISFRSLKRQTSWNIGRKKDQ